MADGNAEIIDIFIGIPAILNGRPMMNLSFDEATAIADLYNAMDQARLGELSATRPRGSEH